MKPTVGTGQRPGFLGGGLATPIDPRLLSSAVPAFWCPEDSHHPQLCYRAGVWSGSFRAQMPGHPTELGWELLCGTVASM